MKNKDIEKLLREDKAFVPNNNLKEKIMHEAPLSQVQHKEKNKSFNNRLVWTKLVAVAASFVLVVAIALTVGLLYIDDYQTIYMDVNPSISLSVNVYGTVNKIVTFDDELNIAEELNVKGKNVEKAVENILSYYNEKGILDDAEVFFSIKGEKNSKKIMDKICKKAEQYSTATGINFDICKQKLDNQDIENATKLNISPGKYKVINEILKIDNSYDIEQLKHKTMKELNAILKRLSK